MNRSLLGVLAASLLFTFTACEDDGDSEGTDPKTESSSDPTRTTDSTDTDEGGLSEEELQAKIVTGAPPKELTWIIPSAPADWRELKAETGTRQWQVGDSRCIVTVNQPAGLGTGPTPTSEDVAKDYVGISVKQTGATADLEPATQQLFANQVNSEDLQVQSEFAGVHFTGTSGLEGQSYGYRSGDFALRALALCGSGEYADHGAELEQFLRSLAARTTY
ncbi:MULTISPECIES: hypothetical protein [unclassified Nocardioides]|uniref:hypothetical protein n=1 Tax=unclassified Nocardioides TaxID=2615069 RepID=UPI0006FAC9E6|nr:MULTISPECIES: hypothetical protein [unclassified Nocardioides]KRA29430.1 hypothetical protein ASD81_20815 [Nocardioides sp. Root614]KRA88395.1 hypothetical protein ASD84_20800 [Nocardioides sp. Root682]